MSRIVALSACLITVTVACDPPPGGPRTGTVTDTLGKVFSVSCSDSLFCTMSPRDSTLTPLSCDSASHVTGKFALLWGTQVLAVHAVAELTSKGASFDATEPARPIACVSPANCLPDLLSGGYSCVGGLCQNIAPNRPTLTVDAAALCQADIPWPTSCPFATDPLLAWRMDEVASLCGTATECSKVPEDCRQPPATIPGRGTAGTSGTVTFPQGPPCDIYAAEGGPCVAAHSTIRRLSSTYTGPLYQVRIGGSASGTSGATAEIGFLPDGFADGPAQDAVCASDRCTVSTIYDQSGRGNHLTVALGGSANWNADSEADAKAFPIEIGGRQVYGVRVTHGIGYRNNRAMGTATGDDPETIYMIASGDFYNDGCCFEYGNAETNNVDNRGGAVEAVYFGGYSIYGTGAGSGPWVMADLGDGTWAGSASRNQDNPSVSYLYVTAMVKGDSAGTNHWTLKVGNAQAGSLTMPFNGARPSSQYNPMRKEGAIILGISSDNANFGQGRFFEGVMTAHYSSNKADEAVQANIVSAYGLLGRQGIWAPGGNPGAACKPACTAEQDCIDGTCVASPWGGMSCDTTEICPAYATCCNGSNQTCDGSRLPSGDGTNPGQFDVSADGLTVTDTITGLVWQRDGSGTREGCGGSDKLTCTWAQAKAYCASLSLGGVSGWRLPARMELSAIVDFTKTNPTIDAAAFPNTPAALFWTSSPVGLSSYVDVVYFSHGGSDVSLVGNYNRVRCVR